MVHAPVVCDLAVAPAYAMLGKPDPIARRAPCHRRVPRRPAARPRAELSILFDLIRARLALSVTIAARQQALAPDNAYLGISQRDASALLARLDSVAPAFAEPPSAMPAVSRRSALRPSASAWLPAAGASFARVLDPGLRCHLAHVLDLSAGSLSSAISRSSEDVAAFTTRLFARMRGGGRTVGVGGYDEARLIYRSDMFRREGNDGPEWRTVHIGLDLFAPAGYRRSRALRRHGPQRPRQRACRSTTGRPSSSRTTPATRPAGSTRCTAT